MGRGRLPQPRLPPGNRLPACCCCSARSGQGWVWRCSALLNRRRPRAAPRLPDSREAIRREMLRLKGTWSSMQTLESTINGVPQPPRRYKMIWSIDRDTITETDPDGFAARTYRYSLDLGQSPSTIDLTVLNIGLTLHGLYKLDGRRLDGLHGRRTAQGFRGSSGPGPIPNPVSTGRAARRRNWPRSAPTPRVATGRSTERGRPRVDASATGSS